jgi:hypothetical protein
MGESWMSWEQTHVAFHHDREPHPGCPICTGPPAVDCPGCGAPAGYPPAGPCENHGTLVAVASNQKEVGG